MLSVFPELFNYSEVAPVILRVALFAVLISLAYPAIKAPDIRKKVIAGAQALGAILILVGFLTQPAAILVVVSLVTDAMVAKNDKVEIDKKWAKILVAAIAISLLFSGPGLFAIDLPL